MPTKTKTKTTTNRSKVFTVRMSGAEWEQVQRLAAHYAVPVASLFRMLMTERAREVLTGSRKK